MNSAPLNGVGCGITAYYVYQPKISAFVSISAVLTYSKETIKKMEIGGEIYIHCTHTYIYSSSPPDFNSLCLSFYLMP